MNTAVRDFSLDKGTVYNQSIHYLSTYRDNPHEIMEFVQPKVNNKNRQVWGDTELQVFYDPYQPRENQYLINHETFLMKPETKSDVLEVLLSDIAHTTNGLVFLLNKVVTDFNQDRRMVFNDVIQHLVMIRAHGLEIAKH